jgi:hypothetical protein
MLSSSVKQIEELTYTVLTETCCPVLVLACGCFKLSCESPPPPHSRTVHLDIIQVFYLPNDAQKSYFKKKIKIYIKTAPKHVRALWL